LALVILFIVYFIMSLLSHASERKEFFLSFVFGIIFGLGLLVSGMCDPELILSMLDVTTHGWNSTLLWVFGTAVGINLITFWLIRMKFSSPIYGGGFEDPGDRIDARLIIGAALFGFGWGFVGLCPGPAMISLLIQPIVPLWIIGMALGQWLSEKYDQKIEKNSNCDPLI